MGIASGSDNPEFTVPSAGAVRMACMGKKEHDNLEDMNEVTGERDQGLKRRASARSVSVFEPVEAPH